MTLILFSISVFGNLSALRTIKLFRSRALVSTNHLTKIGTGSCAIIIAALFLFARDLISASIALISVLGSLFLTLWFLEQKTITNLKREVPAFLDCWILNMKLGKSLSAARTEALLQVDSRARALLEPVFINASLAVREHLILHEKILPELLELAREPHSALARLEHAREWLRKSEEFRRKSGQATRQTTIQAVVLLVLLIALAVFTVHRHGWRRNSDLIIGSMLISALGIATMRQLARKRRWKI